MQRILGPVATGLSGEKILFFLSCTVYTLSNYIDITCELIIPPLFLDTGSHYVVQASLNHLISPSRMLGL
jgi:hypothetical protein